MNIKDALAEKIAGEITFSPKPGQTIRKWRNIFHISQTELAKTLGLSPSVISDYESGRRKSPGINTIRKIIEAYIEVDEKQNDGKILRQYKSFTKEDEGIIQIEEYPYGIPIRQFIKQINGKMLTTEKTLDKKDIKGFTLVDSIKTIKTINSANYVNLYGWSTERALIFTEVTYGRSPMIAIKMHPIKPMFIVYHRPGAIDPLAINLAEQEQIPLIATYLSIDELQKKLILLRE